MEKPKFLFENDLTRSSEMCTTTTKTCPDEDVTESKLIKDFGSYTTLHGFHFIFDSGSPSRRIFWFCLMLFGFGALTTQVFFNICRLLSNEMKVHKSIEVPTSVRFPAVTICNQNMLKKSKILGTPAQHYLDQLDQYKFMMAGQKKANVPPFDIEKVVRESGHNIQEMVRECIFANESCSWTNFTRTSTTSFLHGNCFTFNAGSNGSSIRSIGSAGTMQSLRLRLDAEFEEYYGPFSYDATGFKVVVHDQGKFPDIEEEGYNISPGFSTSLRIKKVKEIYLPPPYQSMCGSRKLINFDKYTLASCREECLSKTLAKKCNCRILSMVNEGINVTQFCSTDQLQECIYPEYRKSVLSFDHNLCDCPQECESISYKVQVSSAYYPSEHLWDAILPFMYNFTGLNASIPDEREKLQTFVRKRYAMLTIFFQTLETYVLKEMPSYTLTNFWADIGGNMGLFLGCSIMTVCEFIDLMLIIFLKKWRKANQVPKKTQVQSLPPTS